MHTEADREAERQRKTDSTNRDRGETGREDRQIQETNQPDRQTRKELRHD